MDILSAVNILLDGIGEDRVNSLNTGYTEATQAQQTIQTISQQIQTKGYWFNRDLNITLHRDTALNVPLPNNVLSVSFPPNSQYVQRGKRVYDRVNHTFVFKHDVVANLIVLLEFEDLPSSAQNYIVSRAARIFQDNILGSMNIHSFQEQDEQQALLLFEEDELLNSQYNIFNNQDIINMNYRGV